MPEMWSGPLGSELKRLFDEGEHVHLPSLENDPRSTYAGKHSFHDVYDLMQGVARLLDALDRRLAALEDMHKEPEAEC